MASRNGNLLCSRVSACGKWGWTPPFSCGPGESLRGATGRRLDRATPVGCSVFLQKCGKAAVTNAQFRRFVEATGYVTIAERKPDWEELKKQVPPGTPKPPEHVLVAGSGVFRPTEGPVDLTDRSEWWRWQPGADWRHPGGPGASIEGKDDYPVVQVAWEDAAAYAKWAGKRLPTEAEYEFAARGGLNGKWFAWGDEFTPDGNFLANTWQRTFTATDTGGDGFKGTAPVSSFPANGYGLFDMTGNVRQHVSDW
ncbi:MAG: SUMF1/EgtB/PvdO family nonheme iron enzyme [Stellaceae bacterium]